VKLGQRIWLSVVGSQEKKSEEEKERSGKRKRKENSCKRGDQLQNISIKNDHDSGGGPACCEKREVAISESRYQIEASGVQRFSGGLPGLRRRRK